MKLRMTTSMALVALSSMAQAAEIAEARGQIISAEAFKGSGAMPDLDSRLQNIFEKKSVREALAASYNLLVARYGVANPATKEIESLHKRYLADVQTKLRLVADPIEDSASLSGTSPVQANNSGCTTADTNHCICHVQCHSQCHGSRGWR
ncbi:MAG: hypothetical protein WC801_06730 [Patescibacteria group bacterium]|jgi:hypothetical protein